MLDPEKFKGSEKLYGLIDRLQIHSEWKYPNRKWSMDFYYECAWLWRDKMDELEAHVLKLETEMNNALNSTPNGK